MAGVQIGDIVRLTELAWQVYNYGFSADLRASEQYAAFFTDVQHLAEQLSLLVQVVNGAQQSLQAHASGHAPRPRWHLGSFLDIVGDYQSTLTECRVLIDSNNRYRDTTNPVRNIEWNVLVQPAVERLRGRILLHNTRIQHALRPFEIDLLTRIYEDLARRIDVVGNHVHELQNDLRALTGFLVPTLAEALESQSRHLVHRVEVPAEIGLQLDHEFGRHPQSVDGGYPSLRAMADGFLASYEHSIVSFVPDTARSPPVAQYICLLKCQFLIDKIQDSQELLDAPRLSHWPSFIKSLEEKLSHECRRLHEEMAAPEIPNITDIQDMLALWPEEPQTQPFDTVTARLLMEDLLEAPLAARDATHHRTLRLMRHTGTSDDRYRLIITVSIDGQLALHRRVVDFDISTSVLNPVYALPSRQRVPLEVLLEENNNIHRLVFLHRVDLYKFQQALTGFKVVDDYAEDYANTIFVAAGQASDASEDVSLQLWNPRRLAGPFITDDSNTACTTTGNASPFDNASTYQRRDSTASVSSTSYGHWPSQPQHRSITASPISMSQRRGTISSLSTLRQPAEIQRPLASPGPASRTSVASLATTLPTSPSSNNTAFINRPHSRRSSVQPGSNSSSASDHAVTVSVVGSTTTGTGIIYNKPTKPLLVLFTKNPNDGTTSLVTLAIDEGTKPNPERCLCRQAPEVCRITALEQQCGARPLGVLRRPGPWNLLPLAAIAQRRNEAAERDTMATAIRIIRVSIFFRTVAARKTFGGGWCECDTSREGLELECMRRDGHVGLFGQLSILYRRQITRWHERNENRIDLDDQPP
ncbi:hypothetical protein B0T24DRAFT_584958 [Lasiosphaeria ovina]|uniref:Uncharacterized protein n=1 Tax=Lasiosphaeria ovina TaxID=92902 RepID=A0AAE0MZG8_9PEZI|nr:hypothetical protein B0T24DRAFT_584958 [Lasiosphaeria ovina]